LSNSNKPGRAITWQGKQLVQCKQKELIDCILHLSKQCSIADIKITELEKALKDAQSIPAKTD
jgi:hypothetical protein